MATLAELEAAFIAADEVGNTDDAQAFADEIVKLRGKEQPAPTQKEEVSPQVKDKQDAKRVLRNIYDFAAEPFVSAGKLAASGAWNFTRPVEAAIGATQRFVEGDALSQLAMRAFGGGGRIDVLDDARSALRSTREANQAALQGSSAIPAQSITGQVYQGLGGLPVAYAEWNPAVNAMEAFGEGGDIFDVAGAIGERAAMGGILGMVAKAPGGEVAKRFATGSLMGGHGYAKTGDIEGAVANAALGGMMPQRKVTVGEVGAKRFVEGKRDFTDVAAQKLRDLPTQVTDATRGWLGMEPRDMSPVERKYSGRVNKAVEIAFPGLNKSESHRAIEKTYGEEGMISDAARFLAGEAERNALSFTNNKGEIKTGRPKNYGEYSEAVANLASKVKTNTEDILNEVVAKPGAMEAFNARLPEIAKKFDDIANDPINNREAEFAPMVKQAANVAADIREAINSPNGYSPQEILSTIERFNRYVDTGKTTLKPGETHITQEKLRSLRNLMNDWTTEMGAPEWKQQRRLLAGLIEMDKSASATRSALLQHEKNPVSGGDIYRLGEVGLGVATGRPIMTAMGTAGLMSNIARKMTGKDRNITELFDAIEQEQRVKAALGRRVARRAPMTQEEINDAHQTRQVEEGNQ